MSRAIRLLVVVPVLVLFAPALSHAQPVPLRGLDAYIEQAMRDWEVPGLAIAVVRNDSVIHARGFGIRQLGVGSARAGAAGGAVDENTMFAIASTTKAMTVAALGMLVDERRLRWDDPVARHMPALQLQDPYVTRALTVRDLLNHRSGLSRSDNLWIAAPFDRAEVLRRTRYLPAPNFRAEYGYNNLMYIAAGELVASVSGKSWDDFLEERLFGPLGMTRTTSRSAVVAKRDNVASSHSRVDSTVVVMKRRNYDNIGGAGAVYSSVRDMAQWIRLHLNGGTYEGKRLLQPATLREMHTPQTVMPIDSASERMFPTTHFRAYGLGWFLHDYHGRKVVYHSGSINQTRTQVGMVPSEKIGVVVIANLSSSNLQTALMYRVLDALMGVPPRDWSAEYLANARRSDERSARQRRDVEASRIADTRPSLALNAYAGTYEHEVYGEMKLTVENGHLVLTYSPDYIADLEHWHHDTFRAVWRSTGFGRAFVTFSLDSRARAAAVQVDGFGTFERAAPPRSEPPT